MWMGLNLKPSLTVRNIVQEAFHCVAVNWMNLKAHSKAAMELWAFMSDAYGLKRI